MLILNLSYHPTISQRKLRGMVSGVEDDFGLNGRVFRER